MRLTPTQVATLEVLAADDVPSWRNLSAPRDPKRQCFRLSIWQELRGTKAHPTWVTARAMARVGLVEVRYPRGYERLNDFIQLRITEAGAAALREATS